MHELLKESYEILNGIHGLLKEIGALKTTRFVIELIKNSLNHEKGY